VIGQEYLCSTKYKKEGGQKMVFNVDAGNHASSRCRSEKPWPMAIPEERSMRYVLYGDRAFRAVGESDVRR